MDSFKFSNSSNEEIFINFEPIGDTFNLLPKEAIQIIPFDKGSGLGTDALNIEMKTDNGKTIVVIWAETHKFKVLHDGKQVNHM